MFVVPPEKRTVPLPLTLELAARLNVRLANWRTLPVATVKVPPLATGPEPPLR